MIAAAERVFALLNEKEEEADTNNPVSIVDEDGIELGTLTEILQTGANDVYEMTRKDNQEKVYIPAIRDCIKEIDPEAGRIVIHVMDGLL